MSEKDFTTLFAVDKTPADVFSAISNVRGWWSEEIEGNTDQAGSEFTYHYQDVPRCKIKIEEYIPGSKVVWKVLDNYFSFTKDKDEWKGNTIVFEIKERDKKTELQFTQHGLVPAYECYDICENAWNTYIHTSLLSLVTTGKGQPNSKDKPRTGDENALSAPDFTTTFFVTQSPSEVFNAVNNVRGWWQGHIEGSTDKPGDEFTYRMKDVHYSRQRITEMVPDKKVTWLITDSQLNFLKKKDEWTGTKILFDIAEINNKTQLRFTHQGLSSAIECYGSCSNAWSKLIQQSLQSLITTGKGQDVF